MIFTSSDVVYGHSHNTVFSESDYPNPFGLYASQKAAIESLFQDNSDFFSLRLSLVTGNGSKLLRILSEEENPKIPGGVIRNPVHFKYVVETIKGLIAIPGKIFRKNWFLILEDMRASIFMTWLTESR